MLESECKRNRVMVDEGNIVSGVVRVNFHLRDLTFKKKGSNIETLRDIGFGIFYLLLSCGCFGQFAEKTIRD